MFNFFFAARREETCLIKHDSYRQSVCFFFICILFSFLWTVDKKFGEQEHRCFEERVKNGQTYDELESFWRASNLI